MINRDRHLRLLVPILLSAVLTLASCGGDDGDGTTDAGGEQATVVKGAGDIQGDVDEFRSLLGPDNGGAPDGDPEGRREINWDKVPDQSAAPNPLPGDFFNGQADPVARGALLETPGDHVAVSADRNNPTATAVRFGDINPTYSEEFRTFSAERLFSPVGSNVVNLTFFVPGTDQPGLTRGFGAVYTDIDKTENTAFEYFDSEGNSLGKYAAPVSDDGLSFLGVVFERPLVARVRIEYGTDKLGPDDSSNYDVAVMDDFIYGEPQPAD